MQPFSKQVVQWGGEQHTTARTTPPHAAGSTRKNAVEAVLRTARTRRPRWSKFLGQTGGKRTYESGLCVSGVLRRDDDDGGLHNKQ
jgi:hypothetical protein